MRRVLSALAGFALAGSLLVPSAPAMAACGVADPYDRPTYTFYWYDCRRSETPNPDLLPYLDPDSGALTICVDRYSIGGEPNSSSDCRTINLLTATLPTQVCMPPAGSPVGTQCAPLPEVGSGGGGGGDPQQFPYDEFQVCTPDGSICQDTFWSVCAGLGDQFATDLACVGAGVQFTYPTDPSRGIDQVCIAVGTPLDPPGTWTMACVPIDQARTDTPRH